MVMSDKEELLNSLSVLGPVTLPVLLAEVRTDDSSRGQDRRTLELLEELEREGLVVALQSHETEIKLVPADEAFRAEALAHYESSAEPPVDATPEDGLWYDLTRAGRAAAWRLAWRDGTPPDPASLWLIHADNVRRTIVVTASSLDVARDALARYLITNDLCPGKVRLVTGSEQVEVTGPLVFGHTGVPHGVRVRYRFEHEAGSRPGGD